MVVLEKKLAAALPQHAAQKKFIADAARSNVNGILAAPKTPDPGNSNHMLSDQFFIWAYKTMSRWKLCPAWSATEQSKILYAASLLKGEAAIAVRDGVEDIMRNWDKSWASWEWRWASGKQFMDCLAKEYYCVAISKMLLKLLTTAYLLATTLALPSPPSDATTDDDLFIISTKSLPNGDTLTVYGNKNPSFLNLIPKQNHPATLKPRCGTNAITCYSSHIPAPNTCNDLLSQIRGSTRVLSSSPRSVCLRRNGRDCCVSWAADVGSVREGDLYNAAKKTADRCVAEGRSGKAGDRKAKPVPTGRPRGRPKGSGVAKPTATAASASTTARTARAAAATANTSTPIKRGRGRPRKDDALLQAALASSSTPTSTLKAATATPASAATASGEVKRGRGRPRKSDVGATLSKAAASVATPATEGSAKRGRGRPKGSKNKTKSVTATPSGKTAPKPTVPARGGPGRGRRSVVVEVVQVEDSDEGRMTGRRGAEGAGGG
ncbi:hypothetical protein N0V88_001053 [Collariella sp. IMI 366227]|nr:hypothetical protein N0V88_001053 [Collariella sp. IMI 366227]